MRKEPEVSGGSRRELLISLKGAQYEHRDLSREVLLEISRSLDVPFGEIFGVATFYSFLSVRPRGRNVIRICRSVPCYLRDAQMIIDAVADELGIGPGETTEDGSFSFELASCIGACDSAPAMLVDFDVHGDLTPAKVSQVLRSYR